MIHCKTSQEIEIMAKGGKILSDVLREVLSSIKPGVTELEVDELAERLIRKKGAEPGFQKVEGYHFATCISTNEVVVHGIPTNYVFKEGDIVGVDCGVYFEGFHTDMAQTLRVKKQKSKSKNQKDEVDRFLEVGEKALSQAIEQAVIGNRVGHISKTIQNIVEGKGYSVVRSLIGHGVGRELHEEPEVPGFLKGTISKTPLLKEGMVIAIEVIYNMGKYNVEYTRGDSWTIKTSDNSLSGLFERTVAIAKKEAWILTP